MPFERFDKRAAGKVKRPTITVQRRGTLSLNAAAAVFLAGQDEIPNELSVELFFDRDKRIIGVRKATEDHPSVYTMRKQAKSDSFLLAGKAFTQYYGIETGGSSRRYFAQDYGDGILGAELDSAHTVVSRERDDDDDNELAAEGEQTET